MQDIIVDFFHAYVDECHHNKEEHVFFKLLLTKPLKAKDWEMIDQI